jgi:hypothetical protein
LIVRGVELLLGFGEHGLGDLDGGHGFGPASVEREVDDLLFKFGFGKAVLYGEAEVVGELFEAARRDQACEGAEAAVAPGELGPLPDVAEENLVGQFDELGAKSPMARWSGVGSVIVVSFG